MADMSSYPTPHHFQRSARPSVSSSPRPSSGSSPLARAQWPWSTSSLQYAQRPSSAMSSQALSNSNHWEASSSSSSSVTQAQSWTATPKSHSMQQSLRIAPEYEDHGIKQWNFSVSIWNISYEIQLIRMKAFEWTVPNIRDLKRFVESQSIVSTAASLHSDDSHASYASAVPAVLRETPVVDGKFKLEIGRASAGDESTATNIVVAESPQPMPIPVNSQATPAASTTLSLCLTSLQLDYDQTCEIGTTIMAGIKSNADFTGQRGARVQSLVQ